MSYLDYFQEPSKDASLEEKIAIIKSNRARAINMLANLKDCKRISNNKVAQEVTSIPTSPSPCTSSKEENETAKSICNRISLFSIEGLYEDAIIEAMRAILKDYTLNQALIDRLKLLLYKELMVYSKMVLDASNPQERQDLERAIDAISTKIDLLDEITEAEEVSEEDFRDTNNNIFFLVSDSGNVILQESLRKDFPRDYYPLVKELILRFKNGNIHNVKRLAGCSYLQMRLYDVRITFEKLSRGNYIIFDTFVKKNKNGKLSKRKLWVRLDQYNSKKAYYVANHQKPEFIKEHEGYLSEILTLLDSKKLSGDEQNEGRNI